MNYILFLIRVPDMSDLYSKNHDLWSIKTWFWTNFEISQHFTKVSIFLKMWINLLIVQQIYENVMLLIPTVVEYLNPLTKHLYPLVIMLISPPTNHVNASHQTYTYNLLRSPTCICIWYNLHSSRSFADVITVYIYQKANSLSLLANPFSTP